MQELLGGLLYYRHDLRMGVAGRTDRDAGGEVEETVAVDVPGLGAAAMRHHERIVARIRRRDHLGIARDHGLRLGAGEIGLDMVVAHGNPSTAMT
jgi:hypothetical protein